MAFYARNDLHDTSGRQPVNPEAFTHIYITWARVWKKVWVSCN